MLTAMPLNPAERAKVIVDSHRRSMVLGVDQINRNESQHRLSQDEIIIRKRVHAMFYSLAVNQMQLLRDILDVENFLIAIIDSDGYVLEVDGGERICAALAERNCATGYKFTEEEVGTTAISLCMRLRCPFQLSDKEHFCARVHDFTSSAAPVFDPDGNLLGVLMITGSANLMHPHTLAMLISCARAIEMQQVEIRRSKNIALQAGMLDSIVESVGTGLMVLDDNLEIIRVNEAGRRITDPDKLRNALIDKLNLNIKSVTTYQEQWNNREWSLQLNREKVHLQLTAKPITIQDKFYAGIVLSYFKVNVLNKVIEANSGSVANFSFKNVIGNSDCVKKSIKLAERAALSDAPVLIQGETGTGKELFAQAIHNASDRYSKPFIPINCGAIPQELLESELFGYMPGAFTGASKDGQAGKFEMASGGTLLLDEIGDMPYNMQLRLLRVLQTQEIYRIGSSKPTPINTRIIATTNVDLATAVASGIFRHDLYYRLNVFPIFIPPLRERGAEDILMLAEYFLEKNTSDLHQLAPEALSQLVSHPWPGNVRELENCICRTLLLTDEKIITNMLVTVGEDESNKICKESYLAAFSNVIRNDIAMGKYPGILPHKNLPPTPVFPLAKSSMPKNSLSSPASEPDKRQAASYMPIESMAEMECRLIRETLAACDGNIAQVCEKTGLSRATLYRKFKRYGISRK